MRDDGQFFGYRGVGQGYLQRFTRFLFIPAIRDASEDASEGKGSVITDLMDMVVRSVLASREEVIKLREETQAKYEEIMNPSKLEELSTLAGEMTKTLQGFVPDASVDLRWQPLDGVDIPLPRADVRLVEDGYSSLVGRTGHGLQRAFILTLLQHLALAQTLAKASGDQSDEEQQASQASLPNLVLAIEEPEIYQHPNRQRHLAQVLAQLASGKTPGVAEKTQVIYATHSPLFVGIDRIHQVRMLRKCIAAAAKPKVTRVIITDLDRVAEVLWEIDGRVGPKYTGQTLAPRLQSLMTPWMNEGFFADVVILVEGEDDRAAILGTGRAKGIDLESQGFAVIPCGGKTSLDRPALVFRQLGIPVYIIWDGDKGEKDAKPEDNHRLLKLVGQPVVDWPAEVHHLFTCFERELEVTLRDEIGMQSFDDLLKECQNDLGIRKKRHAIKNPCVIDRIIRCARERGCESNTLDLCLSRILALKFPQYPTEKAVAEALVESAAR